MSIEAALAEVTTALKAHGALLERVIAGQTKAIETATSLSDAKVTGRPPGSKNKVKETAAADAPKPDAAKPEAKQSASVGDKMTPEQDEALRNTIAGHLSAVNDGPERDARKKAFRAILDKHSIAKVPETPASLYDQVLSEVKAVIDGDNAGGSDDLLG